MQGRLRFLSSEQTKTFFFSCNKEMSKMFQPEDSLAEREIVGQAKAFSSILGHQTTNRQNGHAVLQHDML